MSKSEIQIPKPKILKATCAGHRAAIYALEKGRTQKHFLTSGGDGWVVEWNREDPEIGKVLATVEGQVFSLLNLPEKGKIIAGTMTGGLHFIDLEKPERTKSIQHHGKKSVFQILKTGFGIFSLGGDGVLTRWDLDSARPLESLQVSGQSLRCAVESFSGGEIFVGSSDRAIYIIDAEALAVRAVLPEAHKNSVFSLAVPSPGNLLLSGGRDAMLKTWNLNFPKPEDGLADFEKSPSLEIPAHLFSINDIKFSPDGKFFATASRDKTIKIWDSEKMELLKVLDAVRHNGHVNSVNKLLWLENFLASVSDDKTAKIWSFEGFAEKPKTDVS